MKNCLDRTVKRGEQKMPLCCVPRGNLITMILLTACTGHSQKSEGLGTRGVSPADTSVEYRVPVRPPDSIPLAIWQAIHADSNLVAHDSRYGAPFARNFLAVMFHNKASQAERQSAIDAIHGEVVGGIPIGKGGLYYIRLQGDSAADRLFHAIDLLKQYEQVDYAQPVPDDISPVRR